jgi:hypothetical protein
LAENNRSALKKYSRLCIEEGSKYSDSRFKEMVKPPGITVIQAAVEAAAKALGTSDL